MDEWFKQRDELVAEANDEIFSNDIVLNDRELKCEKVLFKLRQ